MTLSEWLALAVVLSILAPIVAGATTYMTVWWYHKATVDSLPALEQLDTMLESQEAKRKEIEWSKEEKKLGGK